jgi:hypothetical protein
MCSGELVESLLPEACEQITRQRQTDVMRKCLAAMARLVYNSGIQNIALLCLCTSNQKRKRCHVCQK